MIQQHLTIRTRKSFSINVYDYCRKRCGLFKIDGATGKVTLNTNKALDYETTPIHELTIQAADATTGTIKTDTAKLTINVKNKAADGAITFDNKTGSLN